MTISEAQRAVDQWIREYGGGYWAPLSNLARLTEEVGELARVLNHEFGEKRKRKDEAPQEIAAELGDVLWVIICLANSLDIDLETAFSQTLKKVVERDANRYRHPDPTTKGS